MCLEAVTRDGRVLQFSFVFETELYSTVHEQYVLEPCCSRDGIMSALVMIREIFGRIFVALRDFIISRLSHVLLQQAQSP